MNKILKRNSEKLISDYKLGFYGNVEFLHKVVDLLTEHYWDEIALDIMKQMDDSVAGLVDEVIEGLVEFAKKDEELDF